MLCISPAQWLIAVDIHIVKYKMNIKLAHGTHGYSIPCQNNNIALGMRFT